MALFNRKTSGRGFGGQRGVDWVLGVLCVAACVAGMSAMHVVRERQRERTLLAQTMPREQPPELNAPAR